MLRDSRVRPSAVPGLRRYGDRPLSKFVRKDGSDDENGDFRGASRSNETHVSTTDPDARLYRKGKTASELRYMGHILIENRNGLVVSGMVTQANGYAEREAAKAMVSGAAQAAPEDAGLWRKWTRY